MGDDARTPDGVEMGDGTIAVVASPPSAAPAEVAPLESWQPSALALMDDETFEKRLEMMEREATRVERVKRALLKEGSDYGTIPGTPKPTLYKPGADTFNKLVHFVPDYRVERRDGDQVSAPAVLYLVECFLVDPQQNVRGRGHGSCSTFEAKYRYRNGSRVCPECGQETIIKGKEEYGGGWLCWKTKGGCGAKYPDGDQRIEGQQTGKIENPDPLDLDNTILQMACKRAYVAATRTAHALSGTFTQDVEDDPERAQNDAAEQAATRKPAAKEKTARAKGNDPIPEALVEKLNTAISNAVDQYGLDPEELTAGALKAAGAAKIEDVTQSAFSEAMGHIFNAMREANANK